MPADPHRISLPDAVALVERAQKTPPRLAKGWSIDGAIIKEILAQPGAVQLRVYLGAKEDGEATPVFLAVNAEGRDLIDGTIAEWAWPCPPLCDYASPFHSS